MTPPRSTDTLASLAGESPAQAYRSGVTAVGTGSPEVAADDVVAAFDRALERLLADPVSAETDGARLRREAASLNLAKRRLEVRQCRVIAALHDQEEASAVAAVRSALGPGVDPVQLDRAAAGAARELGQQLRSDLGLTPSQVKDARRVGDRLTDAPALGTAMDAGTITSQHARILDQTLRPLGGADRDLLEAELVAAAPGMDPRQFRDHCTRRLAAIDLAAAEDAERRRHARRRGALTKTNDAMTALNAQFAGYQAELAHTAVNAFRRHDLEGERRTPEQRTADAIAAAFQAALDAGTTSTKHGVRPHVVITVDMETVTGQPGAPTVAEGAWTGPMVWKAARRILDDSAVSFLAIGQDLPMAVTSEVRTVPIGLHRGLVKRDGKCIRVGCDMPAAWCQVMHLADAYRGGGKLSRTNAALGCDRHHDMYDRGQLLLRWDNGRPSLHPPD